MTAVKTQIPGKLAVKEQIVDKTMNLVAAAYTKVTERKGQAMAEYALIMAAVLVLGVAAYFTLGNEIVTSLTNTINDF